MHAAVCWENLEFVKLLVRARCKFSLKDSKGRTPLALAAKIGRCDIIEALLKYCKDKDKRSLCRRTDNHGWTPLHHASTGGHVNCVKLLLRTECNVNAKDNDNMTPLDLVSRSWMGMISSDQDYSRERDLEETFETIMGYQPRLTQELFFKIVNAALERNSQGVISCIRRYVRFGINADDKVGRGQIPSDSNRWSLLSLAVRYQEYGLLDCVAAEDTVRLAWEVPGDNRHAIVVTRRGQDVSNSPRGEEGKNHRLLWNLKV